MTLEDAICSYKSAAETYERTGWSQSAAAADVRQHVEWLTELRKLRNARIRLLAEIHGLKVENAKLRDAMYSDAKKHALHHMDEEELRIWATQQAELIGELRDLVREMHTAYIDMTNRYEESERDLLWDYSTNPVVAVKNLKSKCEEDRHRFDEVMRELGIES